ncbi:hypothetical protein [Variovorax sp. LG9.2]|uniref:hypothetical protein n=1 Tax=Variovorax sp. LG9.2 TaxID=3048626 RepID=UPI002B231875|nr:hypothetical protein [Variovorax sp. LG9.2]MEB0058298.1 hypothetical protein [Variovorax sp. LG9.2]
MLDTPPFVFVLMPFHKDFEDIYRLGIKQTAEQVGLRAERVDEQMYSEPMLERIYQQIVAADIIVADMTGQNSNVFYEVGYAHARNKLCILMTQNAADIPFDLKQHRHIVYGNSIVHLRTLLEPNLVWAAEQVATAKTSGLSVKCSPAPGDLKLTRWTADATVRLVIDIHNTLDQAFGEIESINLYTGNGWEFSQSGNTSPKTASDNALFAERHSFVSPMRRINPKGWCQLTVVGRKTLAITYGVAELKNTYTVQGKIMIRVVTADRSYDFASNITVEVNDLAF